MSLPSGVSPWNSIFGPGRGTKYNTITYLPMIGIIQTVKIREEIYYSLISPGIIPQAVEGYSRGKKSQRKSTNPQRQQNEAKNLPKAWIDSKKSIYVPENLDNKLYLKVKKISNTSSEDKQAGYIGCVSKIGNNFINVFFFSLISQNLEKKRDKFFMISSIIQSLFLKNSAQHEWARKETTKNLWLLNTETKPKDFPNYLLASIKPRS